MRIEPKVEPVSAEDLTAELAFAYCQLSRRGESPALADFLLRLPNQASREEFRLLVGFDAFVDVSLAYQRKRTVT